MKTDLNEQLEQLRIKYGNAIENKLSWTNKAVSEFFHTYRPIISNVLREFPKFYLNDVAILAGLSENDMPFEKELLQAKILQSIKKSEVILLPRFIKNTIEKVFDVTLENGSIGDGIVFLPDQDQYTEFKICHNCHIGEYINKAKDADLIFIIVDDVDISNKNFYKKSLQKRATKWKQWNGSEILICDLQEGGLWQIKKETPQDLLLNFPTARSRGHRTDEITSPTVSLLYLNEMQAVNKDLTISYPAYFLTESEIYFIEKEKYYFLYGGKLDNAESRDEYKIVSDRMKYHGLKSIHPKAIIGSKEDKLWLEMATSVVEFESKTKTKLCSIGAAEFAKNIGVERINIEQILPGFSFENKNEKENKRQGKQQ